MTYIVVACIGAMIFGLLTNENINLDKATKFFKVDVTAKNSDGNTQLHLAVNKNDKKRVGYLLTKDADVNAKNLYGKTPLHYAALYVNDEIIKLLVFNGANVNAKDSEHGWTPLHHAAGVNSNIEVLECLVSLGADVNAKTNKGRTPLDCAKTEEKKDVLREAGGKSGSDLGSE